MEKTIQKVIVKSVMYALLLLVPQLAQADEIAFNSKVKDANYLTFTAETAHSSIIFNWKSGTAVSNSTDGVHWSEYAAGTKITLANVGDKVMFKGKDVMTDWYNHFVMTGKIAASGDVGTLTDGKGGKDVALTADCCKDMFYGCTSLTEAPELPAMNLAEWCYYNMFYGCTSLTEAPALPATNLAEWCYYNMFEGCTSLTEAPALPATNLATSCYQGMFHSCTALTGTPKLPAMILSDDCYCQMFAFCKSLTTAPALPAMTLAKNCYWGMFCGCKSLTTVPVLPAITLADECYCGMFGSCTSLTNAPALPATNLADTCYLFMFEGCTALTNAPALPATKLAGGCYSSMFACCTALTAVPEMPVTELAPFCCCMMFMDCTSLIVNEGAPGKTWSIPVGATTATDWNRDMFNGTGGDFTGNPKIGKTYYIGAKKEQVGDVTLYRYGDQVGVAYDGELTKEIADTIADKSITNLIIGAGVTKVGDGAFKGWRTLRDVTVGTDCTEVGAQAFYKCPNITNVVCKATEPMAVGDYAFYRCNSLEGISFMANPIWGETPFSFYSGIYMKDGLPEVYAIPNIRITGINKQTLLGTNDLSDPNSWEIVTEETKGSYHFFKIVLGK